MNITVIGGGASGMLAALTASENPENRVILLERQSRAGRKLSASGNGRCNITNTNPFSGRYHGEDPSFSSFALAAFPPSDSLKYFESLGLVCCEQYGGRVYPFSDSSNSVVDALRFALDASGVELCCGEAAKSIAFSKDKGFHIFTDNRVFPADRVIVACGGRAGGKLGGVSDGYELLKSLGHSCTKLYPALVPLVTEGDFTRSLKGVRAQVSLRLGSLSSSGELQFTENGISGPAVFDISRKASVEGGTVEINLLPGLESIYPLLLKRRSSCPSLEAGSLLTGILHNRLSLVMVKHCGIRPSQPIGSLSDGQLREVAESCCRLTLRVKGTGSFDNAQITAGGIRTSEFKRETLESLLVPGLYACGEVLDVDADCGGFNLRWAWASGRLAGMLK